MTESASLSGSSPCASGCIGVLVSFPSGMSVRWTLASASRGPTLACWLVPVVGLAADLGLELDLGLTADFGLVAPRGEAAGEVRPGLAVDFPAWVESSAMVCGMGSGRRCWFGTGRQ